MEVLTDPIFHGSEDVQGFGRQGAVRPHNYLHGVKIRQMESMSVQCYIAVLSTQEAKDKEKRLKASGVGGGAGGAGTEELLLQIQTLTTEKAREDELRNYMQLERVGTSTVRVAARIVCFSTCPFAWQVC